MMPKSKEIKVATIEVFVTDQTEDSITYRYEIKGVKEVPLDKIADGVGQLALSMIRILKINPDAKMGSLKDDE